MDEETKARQIAALIEERRGYELKGDDDRVKQVDASLRALGAAGAPPAKRAAKRPAPKTKKAEER